MSSEILTLVTGANQGIGYFVSKQLASQYKHKVVIGSRSQAKGEAAVKKMLSEDSSISASQLSTIVIDIDDDKSIAAAADEIASKHGRLDILVNNAAIAEVSEGLSTREQFDRMYHTNVSGTAVVTDSFLPLLRKSTASKPGKRIVFVSSELASCNACWEWPFVPCTAYSATKAALNRVILDYTKQLEQEGIQVMAVTPGFCSTNLNGYSGTDPPETGAKSVVISTVEGGMEDTGSFWRHGEKHPW